MSSTGAFYNELIELLTLIRPCFKSKSDQTIFSELKYNLNLLRQVNYDNLLEKLRSRCLTYNITCKSSYDDILSCILTMTAQHNFADENFHHYSKQIDKQFIENVITTVNDSLSVRKLVYEKILKILKYV